MNELRAPALVAGGSLTLMAIIAPFGLLIALPDGRTGVAAIAVLVIAVLDVVAAVALVPVLATGGLLLAQTAAALRIAYAAVFTVAGAALLAPADVDRFHAAWDAGLFVFGAHLVAAGIACMRSGMIPTWIGWLVIVAGAAYAGDSTAVATGMTPSVSLAEFAFVGEIALLLWLLLRAGRTDRPTIHAAGSQARG